MYVARTTKNDIQFNQWHHMSITYNLNFRSSHRDHMPSKSVEVQLNILILSKAWINIWLQFESLSDTIFFNRICGFWSYFSIKNKTNALLYSYYYLSIFWWSFFLHSVYKVQFFKLWFLVNLFILLFIIFFIYFYCFIHF